MHLIWIVFLFDSCRYIFLLLLHLLRMPAHRTADVDATFEPIPTKLFRGDGDGLMPQQMQNISNQRSRPSPISILNAAYIDVERNDGGDQAESGGTEYRKRDSKPNRRPGTNAIDKSLYSKIRLHSTQLFVDTRHYTQLASPLSALRAWQFCILHFAFQQNVQHLILGS